MVTETSKPALPGATNPNPKPVQCNAILTLTQMQCNAMQCNETRCSAIQCNAAQCNHNPNTTSDLQAAAASLGVKPEDPSNGRASSMPTSCSPQQPVWSSGHRAPRAGQSHQLQQYSISPGEAFTELSTEPCRALGVRQWGSKADRQHTDCSNSMYTNTPPRLCMPQPHAYKYLKG